MLPSHTVENYLKAIFLAQVALLPSEQLVPMGQLASALGVVPGTATTMVKALAESGLVRYEPYAGVRLTGAGEKLAARVLRRHRLIELFLVQVMGMSWTEVHDEAEHLEHAVSDRLIERIDEMLGRPSADPHGDPIPGPEGTLSRPPVRLAADLSARRRRHGAARERSGQRVPEIRRAPQSQAGASRTRRGSRPGGRQRQAARTGSRIHDRCARSVEGARAGGTSRAAHVPALRLGNCARRCRRRPRKQAAEPFAITDNSFLVEEAFNQEPGIFQNIANAVFVNGNWVFTFTQEWPVVTQAHQFSYTLSALDNGFGTGGSATRC